MDPASSLENAPGPPGGRQRRGVRFPHGFGRRTQRAAHRLHRPSSSAFTHTTTSRITRTRDDRDGRRLTDTRRFAPTSVHLRRNRRSRSPESVFNFNGIRSHQHLEIDRCGGRVGRRLDRHRVGGPAVGPGRACGDVFFGPGPGGRKGRRCGPVLQRRSGTCSRHCRPAGRGRRVADWEEPGPRPGRPWTRRRLLPGRQRDPRLWHRRRRSGRGSLRRPDVARSRGEANLHRWLRVRQHRPLRGRRVLHLGANNRAAVLQERPIRFETGRRWHHTEALPLNSWSPCFSIGPSISSDTSSRRSTV